MWLNLGMCEITVHQFSSKSEKWRQILHIFLSMGQKWIYFLRLSHLYNIEITWHVILFQIIWKDIESLLKQIILSTSPWDSMTFNLIEEGKILCGALWLEICLKIIKKLFLFRISEIWFKLPVKVNYWLKAGKNSIWVKIVIF